MIMDKRTISLFNYAYDSLYDLNSKTNYKIKSIFKAMNEMENEVLKNGYEFKLNDKSQKFKLRKRVE